MSLAAMLDLFAPEEEPVPDDPAPRRSLRDSGDGLRTWTRQWRVRVTLWGAGPQGAWRAW